MYQHISIVLLFIFITGAHSLRCYVCTGPGSCKGKEKICADGESKCSTQTIGVGSATMLTTKSCVKTCEGKNATFGTTKCCDTDLCNGTGGLYKGGFLLLLSPLFILTLFH